MLGSWVAARLGDPLLEAVREHVRDHALPRPLESTEIVLCPIASNPVSLGAATLALEGELARTPAPAGRDADREGVRAAL